MLHLISRPALSGRSAVVRSASSISQILADAVEAKPLKQAVAYEQNNTKWSFRDVQGHANSLAAGLSEVGWKEGDALALWVGPNRPEHDVSILAAARLGVLLVDIDPSLADAAALRDILNKHAVKGIIYDPEIGDRFNTKILEDVMPELATYDGNNGVAFRSRTVPSMKLVVHTGFEVIPSVWNLKHILVRDPSTQLESKLPSAKTPVYVAYGSDGTASSALDHEGVLADPSLSIRDLLSA